MCFNVSITGKIRHWMHSIFFFFSFSVVRGKCLWEIFPVLFCVFWFMRSNNLKHCSCVILGGELKLALFKAIVSYNNYPSLYGLCCGPILIADNGNIFYAHFAKWENIDITKSTKSKKKPAFAFLCAFLFTMHWIFSVIALQVNSWCSKWLN